MIMIKDLNGKSLSEYAESLEVVGKWTSNH